MFELNPRLAADTAPIFDLPLCQAVLMKDARFPWVILIPRQANLKELHDLSKEDGLQLWNEIRQTSQVMERLFKGDKINVGALGNMVSQLHIHVISRKSDDPAWPGPVWGNGARLPYEETALVQRIEMIKQGFSHD